MSYSDMWPDELPHERINGVDLDDGPVFDQNGDLIEEDDE